MKKLIALLSLVVFAAPAFALNAMSVSEAVDNLKYMASISTPNQRGNIEPAIATLIDAYHANKPFASLYVVQSTLLKSLPLRLSLCRCETYCWRSIHSV